MAKKDMKQYYPKHRKNDVAPVPEIGGKAKSGKVKARPLIAGAENGKVYHTVPHTASLSAADNDLAAENAANDFDMTAADLQDFKPRRS